MKYKVKYQNVYCPDYGIPQKRRRLVLLASRLGEIDLIPPTHKKEKYKTVRDARKIQNRKRRNITFRANRKW